MAENQTLTIRFGIIGCAEIALKVSRAITLSPNATVVAVGIRDGNKARRFISANGLREGTRAHGSYEVLLDDESVDVSPSDGEDEGALIRFRAIWAAPEQSNKISNHFHLILGLATPSRTVGEISVIRAAIAEELAEEHAEGQGDVDLKELMHMSVENIVEGRITGGGGQENKDGYNYKTREGKKKAVSFQEGGNLIAELEEERSMNRKNSVEGLQGSLTKMKSGKEETMGNSTEPSLLARWLSGKDLKEGSKPAGFYQMADFGKAGRFLRGLF
ncbi:hypothetical protein J5N97_022263 [Dioscorea zingiberensis]|uniref:Uncharacterized protein n=1 Tax=Dioscorea zingiberensis TaxID=325984 RepID=A0A9D5CA80_9LILI|nr:hypothetical protein J5N97_022263 [Dioscorea zingiberensis]